MRPGPEFLLRKYSFYNGSRFIAEQYYYADADCTTPTHTVLAKGTFHVNGPSWIVPGGTELDYHLGEVSVVPHTKKAAWTLSQKVNKTCPNWVTKPWMPSQRFILLKYVEGANNVIDDVPDDIHVLVDKDCTHALDWSMNELQLARVEQRNHRHHSMLYLGDVHTDPNLRHAYRPSSYQDALYSPRVRYISCYDDKLSVIIKTSL